MSVVLPAYPAPDEQETLTASDGTSLHYEAWHPAGTPRAGVLLAHGFGEHVSRYGRLARALNRHGYAVGGADHRGMGRSGGARSHVRDYADYVNDLAVPAARRRQGLPSEAPMFVFGHSMGGLIALLHAERCAAQPFAGTLLSGPLLGSEVQAPRWQVEAGKILVRIHPRFRVPVPIQPDILTHDKAEQEIVASDPFTLRFTTLGWFFATVRAMQAGQEERIKIVWPTLWLIPGEDKLCTPAASRRVFERLPNAAQHTWNEYPGLFHEMHNEAPADRDRVTADILAWLDAQSANAVSPVSAAARPLV